MSTRGENKLLLIGHCAEPEIINTDNGTIAKFSLAINDSYTNKSGEKIEKTDWFKAGDSQWRSINCKSS